ncbi:ATP-binding protein [Streptomyces fuscigenes]|uniref:ATP-binding protein n=1 Tax=Streptomyces fuscigenes TaxID=1528880 RepID=UPI001F253762|nr:ATP-binding protein [Streptomyces fuscigenes]MCF3960204.1 ATP-binding protein [Streptomyces fuscigenes]
MPTTSTESTCDRHVALPYGLHSPAVARHIVSRWLVARETDSARIADAEMIVSELVTNAVRHSRGPCVLTLIDRCGRLDIAVKDQSESLPEPSSHPGEWGGYGMILIAKLGGNLTVVPAIGGKTVHVAFDATALG